MYVAFLVFMKTNHFAARVLHHKRDQGNQNYDYFARDCKVIRRICKQPVF